MEKTNKKETDFILATCLWIFSKVMSFRPEHYYGMNYPTTQTVVLSQIVARLVL